MSVIGDKFLEGIAMLTNTSYTQNFIDKVVACDFLSYMNPVVRYKIKIWDETSSFGGQSPVTIYLYDGNSSLWLNSYGNSPAGGPMDISGNFPYNTIQGGGLMPTTEDYHRDGSYIIGVFDYIEPPIIYPITYRLTNATSTGPNEAAVGDTVTVPLTFPEGYGIVNPASDAYVTCNGVIVPSTYTEGQLVFTMPDPS